MLDSGISTLTDVTDALAVWRTLFDPGERVLLKVNCIAYNGATQPAVAYGVAQRLQDAGLRVLRHRRLPPNEGGLTVGQAVAAALRD